MKPVFRNRFHRFPFLAVFLAGLCCLAVLLAAGPASAATTYYVRMNGTGDGTSWEDASSDLAGILNSADSGDEIWVAEGAYRPQLDKDGNSTPDDPRTKTFALKSGVALYGGFEDSGDVSPDFADRDPGRYITVLTGDIDNNDKSNDYGVVNADDINGNNSYHVVYADGVDTSAVLDGFTVTGGKADSFSTFDSWCGGMYNTYSSTTVTNCTFSGNSACDGGGMYNTYSSPAVTNCTFSGNKADYRGGGMYNEYSSPAVTNCTFSENAAKRSGGGMRNEYSNPAVTNCTFSGNGAGWDGGGMWNEDSNPALTNCTFSGNAAEGNGGGMFIVAYTASPSVTVTNCTFSGNGATYGDGMFISGDTPSPTVTNCIFRDEAGPDEFGGTSSPILSCCVVRSGDVAVLYETNDSPVARGDLALQPLADNGGPTMTCSLGAGSIAIDAGVTVEGVSTDQRGVARPSPEEGSFDIGAYEVEWFTVTVSADVGGTVSTDPYGIILSGDLTLVSRDFTALSTPTFVITPEESMDLTGLWLDGGDVSFDVTGAAITLDPLTSNHMIEAVFAVKAYSIVTTAVGPGDVTADPISVEWGGSSAVTVSADAHHHIASIAVDAASVGFDAGALTWSTILFENVSRDHGVTAEFAIDTHTLGVTTTGSGSGSVSPSGGTYNYGTEVTLTATAGEGSSFTGWSGALSGSTNPATVDMTGDKSVTAAFDVRTFTVTTSAGAGGTVSPSGDTSVNWDGGLTVDITPYHGYAVSDVVVDDISRGTVTSHTFADIRTGHNLHATFAPDREGLHQGGLESLSFPENGGAAQSLLDGAASVDLPAGMSGDSFSSVGSADLGDFWLEAVGSNDFGTETAGTEPGGTFLCGVSFDMEGSQGTGVGLLAMDLQLVVSEGSLSTACLEGIAADEEEAGLAEAFLSRVAILKVLSDDACDLFDAALDSGADPLDFFTLSRDDDGFLVGLGLLIADAPAEGVDAVQAIPASGDCRFLVFDGVTDGHFRDPLVAMEKDITSGSDSGCNALPISGLALLVLPLLGLLKKR